MNSLLGHYKQVLPSITDRQLSYTFIDKLIKVLKCKCSDESKSTYRQYEDFILDISTHIGSDNRLACVYINRLLYHHPDIYKRDLKWFQLGNLDFILKDTFAK
jgi:hypothetical protein